ncbi:MAG TPA: gephyrin-like molybdotransferase Glp [Chloroflexota bacterium]|nr:gephyrin-like molybdotransferase Glp [Chloroflexota bacterium]
MPRVSAYPMVHVSEALASILGRAQPLGFETVDLLHARGRILAQDILADADLPGLPRSSVDGYAVIAGDDSADFEVLEEVTAGRLAHAQLRKGTAVYIMTGGTLPLAADAVVMVEEVEQTDGRAVLHHRPARGENVHPPGMDLTHGQLVLAAGQRIGAAEVGLLATVGRAEVPVYRRPRVAVLATGDELVEPHQTPPPGSVRDSNRYALMAAAEEAGAEVVWQAHARDDEVDLERAMREGLGTSDVLITSGGVSMGTRDLIKPLLERMATIQFGRVSFKPGKPLTFATTTTNKLAFGLPGFPVSSLVTFEVFVRPALLQLGGARDVLRPRVTVELGHPVRPDAVRPEYQRATLTWENDRFVARTTGLQSSSRLMSIVGANALLELEASSETLPKGTMVKALLLANL